jgi:hypothetical protein
VEERLCMKTLMDRYAISDLEAEDNIAAQTEVIGLCRFRDLGRDGIRIEYGAPDSDGEYPATVLPHEIARELRGMATEDRERALKWFGLVGLGAVPENRAVMLDGPSLSVELRERVRKIRGGKTPRGDASWLAATIGVTIMAASRYLKGMTVPEPEIAVRVAEAVGWSQERMAKLVHAARLRREAEKGLEQ